jgi:hypothetical protein
VSTVPGSASYPLRVEFFLADDSLQGKTFVAADTYSPADFALGIKHIVMAAGAATFGERLVATATDARNNTSEFSASAAIASTLFGDLDHDQSVGLSDLAVLQSHLNVLFGKDYLDGDLNGDGAVTRADVAAMALHYGRVSPAPTPAASASAYVRRAAEPSSLEAVSKHRARQIALRAIDGENDRRDATLSTATKVRHRRLVTHAVDVVDIERISRNAIAGASQRARRLAR